jgi:hypothetical protein
MEMDSNKLHLSPEHKAFFKDLTNVIISYTPVSGVVDTIKFSHKWFGKRKVAHRIASYVKTRNRRNYIKSRSKKINKNHRKSSRKEATV